MRHVPTARTTSVAAIALAAFVLGWSPSGWSQEPGYGEHPISVLGVQRSYIAHVPANVARPAPVVMVFHGGGGRAEGIERTTGMDELADRYGFIAVYPAGEEAPSGRGGTWNVGGGIGGSSANDVAFVQAILRELEQTVPVDRARVYAAGHSLGGVFAYRLACEMSGTFAAIAAVSATMVERSCHPGNAVAVLHIHGSADDRIPLEGGHGERTATNRSWPAPQVGIAAWSRIDGCSGQPAQSADGCETDGQCRTPVEFCVIPGGGHPWPDGAAERIWAFFAAHPK